jgi:hypothetical protein
MKLKNTKLALLLLCIIFTFLGCGNSNQVSTKEVAQKLLEKEDYEKMYSDPDKYKNYTVDFYCQVFADVQKDDKGTYLQAWANPDQNTKNTLIKINDPQLDVKKDDIIHVTGTVEKAYKGKNAFGAEITAPLINASKIEKSDYAQAFSPAIKAIDVNKEIDQNGYVIKVSKVELAQQETRVYLKITNNSQNKINFYTFNSNATQGNKQFDNKDNFKANYPKLQSNILPGVSTEGILVLQPMDPNGDTIKLLLNGSSDNYKIKINPFVFEIALK